MKITNNHRIISLYITVFIIISLTTIYLPVWLYEIVGLEIKLQAGDKALATND